MNDIIVLEYFTSKSNIDLENKKIFLEAIDLTESIIKGFLLNKNINRLYFVQNSKINILNHKKLFKVYTDKSNSFISVIKKLPKKNVVFIAPEIRNISSNFQKKISKFLPLRHSDIKISETFSSKEKTIEFLKKKSVDHVGKARQRKSRYVIKPIYGAGSFKVKISRKYRFKKTEVIQDYMTGIKGSFSMLCKDKKFVLISCNKQITKIIDNKIIQKGLIIGGLEEERLKIECLAQQICNVTKGLFGLIGVDIIKQNGKWYVLEINPRFTSSYNGILECYGKKTVFQITNLYLTKSLILGDPKLVKTKRIIFS
ncbi:MAG: ATP-grasp domain-containing protein [Alphaproteobacteria bacterium]|tara:strand:- start:2731 stop:3669 length:939 start_codon:yes stop_codon:yes gene_type:complete